MKHLGDITKINGAEIEIVDVITGGSPCQDLSIAGKRKDYPVLYAGAGWAYPAMGGGGMVQSSIWPSNRQMGGEGGLGGKVWRGGSDAAARTDGHQVVPRVHIWQG